MNKEKICVFWFRRDLRLEDNMGLFHALQSDYAVLPIFIFDTNILNDLVNKKDRRVDYIHQALSKIHDKLQEYGSALKTYHAMPLEVFKSLSKTYDIQAVYCNRDYEPAAIQRDTEIYTFFKKLGIPL